MKSPLSFLLMLTILLSSCGSPRSVSSFYHQNKRREGVRNFALAGWVISLGTGLAGSMISDEDVWMLARYGHKINKIQFMATDGDTENPISPEQVSAFVQDIRRDGFEDLILVRDGGSTVNILSKGKDDKLRNLVVLVNDDSDFVFLNLRTSIDMKDISKLVRHLVDKQGWNEDKPHRKRREKRREKQGEGPAEPVTEPVALHDNDAIRLF